MKNKIIAATVALLFTANVNGQESCRFVNEYSVSLNRTNIRENPYNKAPEDRLGFGIGAYHRFFTDKIFQIIFGLEYNRTRFFSESEYYSQAENMRDVTHIQNRISIPVGFRLSVGKKLKLIAEPGIFLDAPFISLYSGKVGNLKTKCGTSYSNSIGIYGGIGICIPVASNEFIIKANYKISGATQDPDIDLYDDYYEYYNMNRWITLSVCWVLK